MRLKSLKKIAQSNFDRTYAKKILEAYCKIAQRLLNTEDADFTYLLYDLEGVLFSHDHDAFILFNSLSKAKRVFLSNNIKKVKVDYTDYRGHATEIYYFNEVLGYYIKVYTTKGVRTCSWGWLKELDSRRFKG